MNGESAWWWGNGKNDFSLLLCCLWTYFGFGGVCCISFAPGFDICCAVICLLVISVCCGLLSFCLALELLLATWSDCAVGTRTFGKIIDYSYFNCVSWFTLYSVKNGISFVFLGTKIRIFIVLFRFFSLASSHWTGFGCLESRRSCLFWFWIRCILGHVFLFKLHSSWRSALMKWLDYLEVPFLELSVLGDRLCQANSSRAYKTTAVWQLG